MSFLTEYERQVRLGLFLQPEFGTIPHLALGLCGEAGEVADEVKKGQYVGRVTNWGAVEKELGDTLWYLTALAGALGLTIEDVARSNLRKLAERHPHLYRMPGEAPTQVQLWDGQYALDIGLPTESGE